MTLYYYFGSEDDSAFEYEVSYGELIDFVRDTFEKYELIEVASRICDDMLRNARTKEERDELIAEFGGETEQDTYEYCKRLFDEDPYLVYDIISDNLDDALNGYEDVINDYFEESARDAYEDYVEYNRDIYSYNGVSRSDFF